MRTSARYAFPPARLSLPHSPLTMLQCFPRPVASHSRRRPLRLPLPSPALRSTRVFGFGWWPSSLTLVSWLLEPELSPPPHSEPALFLALSDRGSTKRSCSVPNG